MFVRCPPLEQIAEVQNLQDEVSDVPARDDPDVVAPQEHRRDSELPLIVPPYREVA